MGHVETRWERSAAALAFGLTAGLGFVSADLVFFTLSVVLKPSGLFRTNPWYYPIPRLLWFAVGVFYAAFPRLPPYVRMVGAMGCSLYWLGWLTRDLILIDRPLEAWIMWVGYIPLAVVSALLSWWNRRPTTPLEPAGFAGRSA
jgi:hypothetical protein